MSKIVLQAKNLSKDYVQGKEALTVLHDVNFTIQTGESVALVGPSGAGKSTLLHILGLLDTATKGDLTIDGHMAATLSERKRTALRLSSIGFVYQFHHLLPEFSALENIVVPQMIAGISRSMAAERASLLLKNVGLEHRLNHRPGKLSGGEQQRVAIVRALANQPKLLLADEPTGNLDPQTADGVFDMLMTAIKEREMGALIATHNMELAKRMDRILEIKDGTIIEL